MDRRLDGRGGTKFFLRGRDNFETKGVSRGWIKA